jgi:hypothetical protein
MKKRFLALTLALTMAMGMTMTAFAEDGENENKTLNSVTKESDIEVTYDAPETYEVTIPSAVTFTVGVDEDIESKETIEAKNVLIKDGNILTVTLKSTNAGTATDGLSYALINSSSSKIKYTIEDSNNHLVENSSVVLEVEPKSDDGAEGVNEKSVQLTFGTNKNNISKATKAGEHKDTLTFTVEVKEKTDN